MQEQYLWPKYWDTNKSEISYTRSPKTITRYSKRASHEADLVDLSIFNIDK